MWKKLRNFKLNGTSSFSRYQKVYILFVILFSNLIFYMLVLSDETEQVEINLPVQYTKTFVQAKRIVELKKGQKISLYDSNSKKLIEEAYFINETSEDTFELAINENEITKIINNSELISILPFNKETTIQKKRNTSLGDDREIIF
jgi:hypothetical protein